MQGKVKNKNERENALLCPQGALGTAHTQDFRCSVLPGLAQKAQVWYDPGVCVYLHVPQHPT